MVNSPKWKIDAASTAVAWPWRMPSTRWSRLPTPPDAITGTGTLSAIACVSGRSKPCLVPSRSLEVSKISPAPAASYAIAASTGSPASRRSTNLTPLTTRPSLTSRQGITRTLNIPELLGRGAGVADQRQRRSGIEPAVVERTAGDGAGELFGAWLKQRPHILNGRKATRGYDGNRDPLGKCDGRIKVEALEQAVARDVRKDDRSDAGILESLRDFERRHLRGLGPAFEGDHMQIFESLGGEGARLRRRVEVEHGRARHVALFEAHALAVLEVDRGKKNHGFHFKKFEISASPKRWLFSG